MYIDPQKHGMPLFALDNTSIFIPFVHRGLLLIMIYCIQIDFQQINKSAEDTGTNFHLSFIYWARWYIWTPSTIL